MTIAETPCLRWTCLPLLGCLALLLLTTDTTGRNDKLPANLAGEYTATVRPFLTEYCLKCHSTSKKKGDLDLERFSSLDLVRKDLRHWVGVAEMLENGEMPPKESPQPKPDQRRQLIRWVRGMLDGEVRAQAGDPGRVVVRRLSNAEYDNTIRDLTGVDLQPTRDFPVDGAAGEGFTNTGDALVISPTLLNKYLNAAKEIAAHTVLLPDGFRFSRSTTRRDWTDEILAELRAFYAEHTPDGKLPLKQHLSALLRHRADLAAGKITLDQLAARDKLSPKYLRVLWQVLNDDKPSLPLDRIRARWRQAKPDEAALLAEINAWQMALWRFVPIGSYRDRNTVRQQPNDPVLAPVQTLKLPVKPAPGQTEVVLSLTAQQFPAAQEGTHIVWRRPRFEGAGKQPLLLRDYAQFGASFEIDYRALFADSPKYLAAAVEAANDKVRVDALAGKHGLDPALLGRWIDLLALAPRAKEPAEAGEPAWTPALRLELLDRKTTSKDRPAINGWRHPAGELPVVLANSSDRVENVPGRIPPHRVAVHPTPTHFVAAVWSSPLDGLVQVAGKVTHAHPACGNGIAWWVEQRRADKAALLSEGLTDLGKESVIPSREHKVARGDQLVLVIDARDGNHVCDLTEIAFTITETGKDGRSWDLARDLADSILDGNPHADRLGNKEVWRFVRGPAKPAGKGKTGSPIAPDSVLARWRSAVSTPGRQPELAPLAEQVRTLLTGTRPTQEKHPDRLLYDALVSPDSPLFQGLDVASLAQPRPDPEKGPRFGLDRSRFGRHPLGRPLDEASLAVPATSVVEVRLPAALFRDREFVVDAAFDEGAAGVLQCRVLTTTPTADTAWDGKSPFVGTPGSETARSLLEGLAEFRRCFPSFVCYPRIVPDDEVVCLKLYHREDEPLVRLFLGDEQTRRLEQLWARHRFITQFPVTEHKNLPLFIGFVTQDQPKALVVYFESLREPFRKRAEEFEKDWEDAAPKQFEALADVAARAYRRPLQEKEKTALQQLYAGLRKKDLPHEEAFRTVLTRVLISPSFLYRIEQAPPGKEAQPVSDWELAPRLSYFLWAAAPDAELSRLAAEGRLRDAKVLAEQTGRLLRDPKVRGLASEFALQWLHVRDIRRNREKNEKLFPTFDDRLREALFEEGLLFFQDHFQNGRSVKEIIDADHTFLNELLAKHYGIPGVTGPQWRRVDGVKKYGRGGVLALGSVLTSQSGASRTSPVLRGNWLVEVLLGEKLPKPPPDVPRLPEDESGGETTVRQLVEKHARIPQCAVCHQRIDPFGFALEQYDPIGRFRDRDLAGRPVDAKVRLKDGTEFKGLEGLRGYLLKQRQEEFLRQYCRKLLGFALGRAVALSDQPLLEEMLDGLKKNDSRGDTAILTIVQSKQFRYHRGLEATKDEQ